MYILLCIPFYYCYDEKRREVTHKIFTHYKKMINELSTHNIKMELLAVGSEKELSKELATRYTDKYYEFDQGPKKDRNSLLKALNNKVQYLIDEARKINPDILLLCGSNDLITINFFIELKSFYNDGYDYYSIAGGAYFIDINNKNAYYWHGQYPESMKGYHEAKCCGGIIGWSNRFLQKVDKIDTGDCADEVATYIQAKQLKFKMAEYVDIEQNFQFWNIKVSNNCELNSLMVILNILKSDAKPCPKETVEKFMKYYNDL